MRKSLGACLLCGNLMFEGDLIPTDPLLHNCDHGRILYSLGSDAYAAWRNQQPGSGMSFDDLVNDALDSVQRGDQQ